MNETVTEKEKNQAVLKTECRSCGAKKLELAISLGKMPLANAYLTADQLKKPEPKYPLDVAFCPDCSLMQIVELVPPEKLFREYLYFSSFSTTMLNHAKEIASRMIGEKKLDGRSLVVEVASNDGYLLRNFKERGIPVLGIEPALNIAKVAEEKGIPTLTEFFNEALAEKLTREGKRADVLIANNVMAHIGDINGFMKSVKKLLKESGVAVIEVPYVKEMIKKREFDTIYHEHIFYFSASAVNASAEKHGLSISKIEEIQIHGGSLRFFITHRSESPSEETARFLEEERKAGLREFSHYRGFAGEVDELGAKLKGFLRELKNAGKRLSAYGAGAKGTVLLNRFGIGKDLLDFVVDQSTHKQGRFIPGVHLPIYPPEKLLEEKPDYVLLLTWNFAGEILKQQEAFRRLGGKFIIPIPEVEVI